MRAAGRARDEQAGREPRPEPDEQDLERRHALMRSFAAEDGPGSWVAVAGEEVVGLATSIRRRTFWGLSLLFVHPDHWSAGVGRRLLDTALAYADGAATGMIQSSDDPRAIRRYARAGFDLHPTFEAEGTVDRALLPSGMPGRDGALSDLDLVEAIDGPLRFRCPRTSDVEAALRPQWGCRLQVVDTTAGRGFVVQRDGRLVMLGATDDATARALLWRAVAATPDGEEFSVHGLTGHQRWAVDVALDARLRIGPSGPMFLRGDRAYPGPYTPSGLYF
jgi:GNAT superfamily N-acetyltransferase